jgi:hypothetical protein
VLGRRRERIFFPVLNIHPRHIPSTGDQALSVRLRGLLKGCCRADEVPAIFHSLVLGYVCDQDLATGHPTSAEIYLRICKQTKAILQCVLQSWKKKHQTMRRHFICGHEKGRQMFNVFCRAKTQRDIERIPYLGATATLLSVTAFCVPREEYGEKQP